MEKMGQEVLSFLVFGHGSRRGGTGEAVLIFPDWVTSDGSW
jgi:hypothetical protein